MSKVKVKDPFEVNLDCIHCGFCLPKCPTYQELGNEADSPRGRIYLMKAAENGRIPIDETFIDHLECCLGCRACESACPSGVRYELMLNVSRARIHEAQPPSFLQRFALQRLLPYPRRLTFLARLLRFYQNCGLQRLVRKSGILCWISSDLSKAEEKLPSIPPASRLADTYPARGKRRYRVGFLSGCVMPVLFPQVHQATIEVLRHSGCEVLLPSSQSCCGALHSHAGDRQTARKLAQENLLAFSAQDLDAILVNSAGCGSAMKEYDHLLETADARSFVAKVKDVCEFLDELELHWNLRPLPERVAYDDPCHLLHGQKVSAQPRRLLQSIPDLTLLSVPNSDRCCGSAGIYNLVRPEMSERLLERKIEEILGTEPERVCTANPGCVLQIQYGLRARGMDLPVQHPLELVYEAMEDPNNPALGSPIRRKEQEKSFLRSL